MLRVIRCVFLFGAPLIAALPSVAVCGGQDSPGAEYSEETLAPSPANLVAKALAAGLAGDAEQRGELLREAVAADPDYAPARWQNGRVKFDGDWLTLDAVADRVTNDPRWAEYAELRRAHAGTLAGQIDLARWCMRKGLENEERAHWINVLRVEPRHELARIRLQVREYNGGLYTESQIDALQEQVAQAEASFARYTPIIADICERASQGADDQRKVALLELRQVNDPQAIPALEAVVHSEAKKASPDVARALLRSMVIAISGVPEHVATQRLLHYALAPDDAELRRLAAEGLTPRPVTDYVPQLMAALSAPIKAAFVSSETPGGGSAFAAYVYQAGPLADYTARKLVFANAYTAGGASGPDGVGPRARALRTQLRYNAELMERLAEQRVAMANMEISVRNARIREVLYNALDVDFGPDPRTYWQEWTSYNELYIPEHPVVSLADSYECYYIPTMSCFALGTPVWTQAGPTPIEHIAVGDLVLAQHPETGELAYRQVLEKTVRPPAKMARLITGDSSVEATLGHRFWINNQGWAMTKFLNAGDSLHTLDGPAELTLLEPVRPQELTEAYNLVVDEFHTYVVGEAKLVVHDNTCPAPIKTLAPGISADAGDAEDESINRASAEAALANGGE